MKKLTRRKFGLSVVSTGFFIAFPQFFHWTCKRNSETDRVLLESIAEVLFPPEFGPSIQEIRFYKHLQFTLNDKNYDPDIQQAIRKGISGFKKLLLQSGIPSFSGLSLAEREKFIEEKINDNEWLQSWLSRLQTVIAEACFLDPHYGVNQHQTGWKWTNHHHGIPRPDSTSDYKTLLAKRKESSVYTSQNLKGKI